MRLGYDGASQRVLASYGEDNRTERYEYDANGYLTNQYINGIRTSERVNDMAGRVTTYSQWTADGKQMSQQLSRTWDNDGQLMQERDNVAGTTTSYTRMWDGTLSQLKITPDKRDATTVTYAYEYEYWDTAKQSKVTGQGSNPSVPPSWKSAYSFFNYDVNGNLTSVYNDGGDQGGKATAFHYWTDLHGQVQRRDEMAGATVDANGKVTGGSANKIHNYYYLNGHRVGNIGNDGIEKIDYVQELQGQLGKGDDNQYKVFAPISTVDFDENFMKITGSYPGPASGSWTARDGDTLTSIASAVWGDATLWYLLADANGLKSSDTLRAGQMLKVPNVVTNIHNTFQTFKPYDPGQAIGNTQPTLPDPPPPPSHGNGCGTFVSVIAIVVAVVATIYTAGAAAAAMSATVATAGTGTAALGTTTWSLGVAAMSGGLTGGISGAGAIAAAAGAAAGSVASQAVLMAGGVQHGFDWKQVGLSTASGVLNAGVGASVRLANGGLQSAMMLGGVRSLTAQGLGIMVGAQQSFDWRAVAASTVASGVGHAVGRTEFGQTFVGSSAAGIAGGIMGSVVRGGNVGREIGGIAADAVTSTIGNMVAQQVAASSASGKATLYGVGDDVDALVVQSGYSADAGKQFAWLANGQLNPSNGVDVAAASWGWTPEQTHARTAPDNGPSIVGSSFSPDVQGFAVPYPQIAVSPLPEADVRLAQTDGGFWRGFSGDKRSVFEAPAPLSESVGAGVRWAADKFVVDPLKELGNQYHDMFSAAGGARDGWSSNLARQVTSGDYVGAALSEAGMVGGVMPLGAGLKGLSTLGPSLDLALEQGVGRLGGLSYVVENGGAGSVLNAPFSPLVEGGGLAAHEAAGGHLLLKHVGQSESQLIQRMANEPTITGSSSFYDRAIAESAISDTLVAKQPEISTWLASSKPQFKVEYSLPKDVGITVIRGASSAVDTSNLRLILRRDPTMPSGYRIHTGFPTQ